MKFSEWKQRLINSKATKNDNYDTKDSSEIIVYGVGSGFFHGMWLQTKERKIIIYGDADAGQINIVHRNFIGDREEGPIHQHAYIELGYVVKGCARQVFSNKEYQFNEGDFWITDYNCYHSDIYFPDELFEVYISIPRKIFDIVFLDSVGDSPIQQFIYNALLKQKEKRQFLKFTPRDDNKKAEQLLEDIVNERDGKQVGMNNIVKGLLARLLSLLSLEYEFLITNQDKSKMHELIYNEVESYIRKNYKTVTIQNLIDRFHYNSDYYTRIIKENSGYTYSEYLQKVRLDNAASMLINTDLPVTEIIEQVGYKSKGYFYKIFEDRYHITPVQYRKVKMPQIL